MNFYPEESNALLEKSFETIDEVKQAISSNAIIESKVLLCDREHNLHVDLGVIRGIIPRDEGALGIDTGQTKDIALISKVNKRVCFSIIEIKKDCYQIEYALLSRKKVQQRCIDEYLSTLKIGDIIDAKVTHLEKFGAFIDIGAGINSLIPIDMLSVSRISHPNQRVYEKEEIKVVLKKIEENKLTFSLKELLGTWEENVSMFEIGETVTGIVRSIESYGAFIELTPNLAGLAELQEDLFVGQQVAVYIKSIIPDKMKVKLVIVELFDKEVSPAPLKYFINSKHIDSFYYSPKNCSKQISTSFLPDN